MKVAYKLRIALPCILVFGAIGALVGCGFGDAVNGTRVGIVVGVRRICLSPTKKTRCSIRRRILAEALFRALWRWLAGMTGYVSHNGSLLLAEASKKTNTNSKVFLFLHFTINPFQNFHFPVLYHQLCFLTIKHIEIELEA